MQYNRVSVRGLWQAFRTVGAILVAIIMARSLSACGVGGYSNPAYYSQQNNNGFAAVNQGGNGLLGNNFAAGPVRVPAGIGAGINSGSSFDWRTHAAIVAQQGAVPLIVQSTQDGVVTSPGGGPDNTGRRCVNCGGVAPNERLNQAYRILGRHSAALVGVQRSVEEIRRGQAEIQQRLNAPPAAPIVQPTAPVITPPPALPTPPSNIATTEVRQDEVPQTPVDAL